MSQSLIVIPSRLGSTRLPQKPLALINGVPMIVRVWQQAIAANIGPVIVACCGAEIAAVIRAAGGQAIITDPDLPSGTDRIVAAMREYSQADQYDYIINLQGDLPLINPLDIKKVMLPFVSSSTEVTTLGARITDSSETSNPNVVKIATGKWFDLQEGKVARAIYFSRQAIPANAIDFYHHVGVYGYRRGAIERFVSLSPSYLEKTEKLEQLRALEDGMRIDVALIDTVPLSVDTQEDLEKVIAAVS